MKRALTGRMQAQPAARRRRRMSRKSGNRFSDKDMRNRRSYLPHSSFEAMRAPSTSAASLAHCTDGWQRTML